MNSHFCSVNSALQIPSCKSAFRIRVARRIGPLLDYHRAMITPETAMRPIRRRLLITILSLSPISLSCLGFASFASAQEMKQEMKSEQPSIAASDPRPGLTGKERLGPKWSDEQRIDNCHVPIDKRGTKPRPSACPDAPPS
jgi:hypothetical protein